MRVLPLLLALSFLAGCAEFRLPWAEREPPVAVTMAPDADVARPEARPGGSVGAVGGRTAEAMDLADPSERAAAAAAQAGAYLGETLASLGAPGETGFWLVTGLVQSAAQGRVETGAGRSVGVELRPSGGEPGAGSRLSLSAMRALDLPLTALAPLRVYAGR